MGTTLLFWLSVAMFDARANDAGQSVTAHAPGPARLSSARTPFDGYFDDLVACIERMRHGGTGLVADKRGIRRLPNKRFAIETLRPDDDRPTHNEDTSPTNIGLDLLVQLERIARRSGARDARANLDRVLATLEKAERHPGSGLFYSWYRAADGVPTNRNVSSVDNIHLALALWVVGKMGPSERVRQRATRLFAAMNFATFVRPESGFVGGNLRHEGAQWTLEPWSYGYLGSEARSVYSLGWALGLFRGVDERLLRQGVEKLAVECSRWRDGERSEELLHTWDGGLFQHFLPELLIGERRYAPELARRLASVARFAYAEGERLGLAVGNQPLPVAASASNGGVDFVKRFGDAPTYVAHSGVVRLTARQNPAKDEPTHRKHWQNLLTPHAVFLLSLFEKDRALRTLATLETVEGPRVLASTPAESLYVKDCGFMDGYWVDGEHKGAVVPVVLHLDHAMAALSAAAHGRSGTMTLAADALWRDEAVSARLRDVYQLLDKRVNVASRVCASEIADVPMPR
jgi:hypothetical protein